MIDSDLYKRIAVLGGIGAAVLLVLWGILWFLMSSNPETPAGYVGYVTQGAIFGEAKFYTIQHGPSSPGRALFLHAVNVSITPYSYTESFQNESAVLAQDNLKVGFNIYLIFKLKSTDAEVRQFVEHFSLLKEGDTPDQVVEKAYGNYIREPLRTFGRVEVQRYKAFEIKSNLVEIGAVLEAKVRKLAENTPFEIVSVVVGNIVYDNKVTDAISAKLVATQDLERYDTELKITGKKAEIRVKEAQGIADAMNIIQAKLTPNYLQHEAIEAQKMMVGSPNHTTIYLPVGPMGVPLVQTLPASK